MLKLPFRFYLILIALTLQDCKKAEELLGSADIERPTITISYPVNDALVNNNISITAIVSDNKKIVVVRFYIDGEHVFSDSSYPYTFYWNVSRWADDGKHAIIAVAEDGVKNSTHSDPVIVIVSQLAKYIPSLISPIDGSENDTTDQLNLFWHKLPGVKQYEVQISENPDFLSIFQTIISTDTMSSFQVMPEGIFYWRVRALFTSTQNAVWSLGSKVTMRSKAAPELLFPKNGQMIDTNIVTYGWSTVSGAMGYRIQVSNTDNFLTTLLSDTTQDTTYNNVSLDYGTYFWRVQTRNSSGKYGKWSNSNNYVSSAQLIAPNLLYPVNNSRLDSPRVTLRWSKIKKSHKYSYQISSDESFLNISFENFTIDTNVTVNLDINSKYYWRVRSYNYLNASSNWSEPLNFSITQLNGLFVSIVGGAQEDFGMYSVQLSDNNYLTGGITHSFGSGGGDGWLVKLDQNGKTMWSKTYGGGNEDRFNYIAEAINGGYLMSGYTRSLGSGGEDGYLVKTDSSGMVLWERSYGGSGDDAILSFVEMDDGSIYCTGYTSSYGNFFQAWLLKLDNSGNEVWKKSYGGAGGDFGQHIEKVQDGLVVSGVNGSVSGNVYDFWLFKIDIDGSVIWDKTYGTSNDERAIRFTKTSDGGFAITGYSTNWGSMDVWLVKADKNGVREWDKNYGASGNDFGITIEETFDNGLVQTGYTTDIMGNQELLILKTNNSGDIIFSRKVGGNAMESGSSINQTKDLGFIITGWTTSFGSRDMYILKTDKNGNID